MPIHFCCVTPRQCQSVWTYLNSENEDSKQQQFPKVQHIIPQLTGPASDKAHYKEKLQAITIQKIGAILFTWTVPQKNSEKNHHRASRSKSAKVVGNGIPPNCRLNFNDDKTWDFEVLYVQRNIYNWKSQLCHYADCFMNMYVISHNIISFWLWCITVQWSMAQSWTFHAIANPARSVAINLPFEEEMFECSNPNHMCHSQSWCTIHDRSSIPLSFIILILLL